MKTFNYNPEKLCLVFGLTAACLYAQPAEYPKPASFRQDTPDILEADKDLIQMVVSDHHVWTRRIWA